jgi:AcrR family transcriptional regulator
MWKLSSGYALDDTELTFRLSTPTFVNVALDTESSQRPLRADARRNREAILKAARAVFSARGREAHLGDVARRAKVGMGTVYRHFPDKDALLEALAREQFELLTVWAREALDAPDPGPALEALLWRGAELQAKDRALMEAVAEFKPGVAEQSSELHACMETLLTRAQATGHIRADATGEDIRLMMCGLGSVMQMSGDGWRRYLTVMLDGMRAG